jgi:ParB-like chromosome segregation protein Spo0J
MATTETYISDQPFEMPLSLLQPASNQPRKYIAPDALALLKASRKEQKVPVPILPEGKGPVCPEAKI